jgi:hypothetical protein
MRSLAPAALALALALSAPSARGQEAKASSGPIQDNSFLLEEAYNQEPGIIQEIQTFSRLSGAGDWTYTLTQEWPVPDETHQLSFTMPVQRVADTGSRGAGDLLLNSRYQLLGNGEARVAVAPRLSLVVPTGNDREGRGSGSSGAQVNLPHSYAWTRTLVTHTNAGLTWLPDARGDGGRSARSPALSAGQSVVWLAHPNLNVMLEAVWARTSITGLPARTDAAISPGLRAAINLGSLQIVPGIAFPIGIGPSSGQKSVFLYLSFEHPFHRMPADRS